MIATADELWPVVSQLPPKERIRLARMALSSVALAPDTSDGERYRISPVRDGEFADDGADPLEWEADGWDDLT